MYEEAEDYAGIVAAKNALRVSTVGSLKETVGKDTGER
jgi:hypothetical protein